MQTLPLPLPRGGKVVVSKRPLNQVMTKKLKKLLNKKEADCKEKEK